MDGPLRCFHPLGFFSTRFECTKHVTKGPKDRICNQHQKTQKVRSVGFSVTLRYIDFLLYAFGELPSESRGLKYCCSRLRAVDGDSFLREPLCLDQLLNFLYCVSSRLGVSRQGLSPFTTIKLSVALDWQSCLNAAATYWSRETEIIILQSTCNSRPLGLMDLYECQVLFWGVFGLRTSPVSPGFSLACLRLLRNFVGSNFIARS